MTDTPVDHNDPRTYPHHYVNKLKGQRGAVKSRAFHVKPDCRVLRRRDAEHFEVVDLDVQIVEYMGLTPCTSCALPETTLDPTGTIVRVLEGVSRASRAGVDRNEYSRDAIAELMVKELDHDGFQFRKNRAPRRHGQSPLEQWAERLGLMDEDGRWDTRAASPATPPPSPPPPPDDSVTANHPGGSDDGAQTPVEVKPDTTPGSGVNPERDDAEQAEALRTIVAHLEARHPGYIVTTDNLAGLLLDHAVMHDEEGGADHPSEDLSA